MPEDVKHAAVSVVSTGGAVTTTTSKVLGPTLHFMGDGLKEKWSIGWPKIADNAAAKTPDLDDGKASNLRVTREVAWHGAITDDEVCTEYFGGILAASRSSDGKDDSAIHYLDCVKAMSARQLHLHFALYHSAQRLFVQNQANINVMQGTELAAAPIWLASQELVQLGLQPDFDLPVLLRLGLVSQYEINVRPLGEPQNGAQLAVAFCMAKITTFGVLLYSIALNKLTDARSFARSVFDVNPAVSVPKSYASTLDELIQTLKITLPTAKGSAS